MSERYTLPQPSDAPTAPAAALSSSVSGGAAGIGRLETNGTWW
jgi:hypothetical protein